MRHDEAEKFIDSAAMRFIVALVVMGCIGLLAYLNRDLISTMSREAETEKLNPAFVKCRDERVGEVNKMVEDGLIKERAAKTFRERAINTCAGQFPPGG